jgi:hypothetical protein
MGLEVESKQKIESLLEMSLEQFDWLNDRWKELLLTDRHKIKSQSDFFTGYVFGKM